ncbi:MAG: hypothetical protein ACUVX8_02535 [Candidatus Zipacnadales bacterium]
MRKGRSPENQSTAPNPATLLGLALLLGGSAAQACDAPVYEYTIHMWDRDPYRVYYFYRTSEDPVDEDVNRLLAETAHSDTTEVNLWFTTVNVADAKAIASGVVAEIWSKHKSHPLPFHVVLTPRGTELTVERLTVPVAKALIDSPKRQRLVDQLLARKQGVLLLLLGPKSDENEKAKTVVKEVLVRAKEAKIDVGTLEVERDDPIEKWLVRQLLNLEDDLPELNNTMLFGIFGRAHALEPFLDRGITIDNITELVYFMNGPCSCEVKATAPGMDLLTKCDWEARLEGWEITDEYLEASVDALTTPQPQPSTSTPQVVSATARAGTPPTTAPSKRNVAANRKSKADNSLAEPAQLEDELRKNNAQQIAASEETHGPQLAGLASSEVPTERPLAAQMGVPLGIAIGVLTFGAIAGGAAVIWSRRGQ